MGLFRQSISNKRNNHGGDENDIQINFNDFNDFNEEDDVFLPNDDTFIDEDELENVNDFRNFEHFENVVNLSWIASLLFPYKHEHIKNVLYVGLHQLFDEFDIKVVKCPCLTLPPYNLAAKGLSGNTKLLQLGDVDNLLSLNRFSTYNISRQLLSYYNDFFVIGTSYAATPFMPCNGLLTINAMISPSRNVINNSCIAYEEGGLRRLVTVDNRNRLYCSMLGNLFLSKGQEGQVIEVRAKGRRTNSDIITLMQNCLFNYCSRRIALGGVLMINGGRVIQHVTPENYPKKFATLREFNKWLKCYELNCNNLIIIGALADFSTVSANLIDKHPNIQVTNSPYKFHSFYGEAAGQFINDITPNETEYIGYFNIAYEKLVGTNI